MRKERYWAECGSSTPASTKEMLRAGEMVKSAQWLRTLATPAEDGRLIPRAYIK